MYREEFICLLYNITLYEYTVINLSIPLLMAIYVVSNSFFQIYSYK